MEFRQIGPGGVRTFRVPQWLAILLAFASAVLALVLLVLAAGAALVLLPVLACVGMIYGWWVRRKLARAGHAWPPDPSPHAKAQADVIDADFVVIEQGRENGDPKSPPQP